MAEIAGDGAVPAKECLLFIEIIKLFPQVQKKLLMKWLQQ